MYVYMCVMYHILRGRTQELYIDYFHVNIECVSVYTVPIKHDRQPCKYYKNISYTAKSSSHISYTAINSSHMSYTAKSLSHMAYTAINLSHMSYTAISWSHVNNTAKI
jgi:hypothetical protein